MAYATVPDVQSRLERELEPDEATLVEARLGDAERLILARIPDLDQKIIDGQIDIDAVKQVEADAVIRLVRNPAGYVQESDGSYTYMLSREAALGRLTILPEEWHLLGYGRRKVFTIALSMEMPT